MDNTALGAIIARRKLVDCGFACLGMLLVAASLSVLVMLFGQLVRDGCIEAGQQPRGQARTASPPADPRLIGALRREQASRKRRDLVRRPRSNGRSPTRSTLPGAELAALEGKPVIVAGDPPPPGQRRLEANKVTAAADRPAPESYSRDEIHGTLTRSKNQWVLQPSPLPLDVSKVRDGLRLAGRQARRDRSGPRQIAAAAGAGDREA